MNPLRVLLVSPLPELDPPCGDVIYTQGLLEHPPPNVQYETYAEALEAGRLREFARRRDFVDSSGRARIRALGRVARERGINTFRRRGLLFREPFRFFSVLPGAYDLVHCHVFSAAFPRLDAPLVMSNASPIEELYRGARGWSERHVGLASLADRKLAKVQQVQHTSHAMPQAAVVVCFTETLRHELLRRGATDAQRLYVAPCFVNAGTRRPAPPSPSRIGFVASDFEAKGGPTVLAAFEIVKARVPEAELLVVGCPPRGEPLALRSRGIRWYPRVSRSELLEQHLPSLDVFAYPTKSDGLPLTVLEVMALGIPVATSDYMAMPEIVGYGRAGVVTPQGDAQALATALIQLLEVEENAKMRQRTAQWFDTHYAPDVAVGRLARAYIAATTLGRQARRNANGFVASTASRPQTSRN